MSAHAGGVVTDVAVSWRHGKAFSAGSDAKLKVWNIDNWTLLRTLTGHTGCVNSVSVLDDGDRIISTSSDKTLKVWSLRAAEGSGPLPWTDHVQKATVIENGALALLTSDNTLKLLIPESGIVQQSVKLGDRDQVSATAIYAAGNRAILAYDTLRVWDLKAAALLQVLPGHWDAKKKLREWIAEVAVTNDGGFAVSASCDRTLKVWDLARGRELHHLKGHSDQVTCVTLVANCTRVISGSLDGTVKLWDIGSGLELMALRVTTGAVYAISASDDGNVLLCGSSDHTLTVWDLRTGARMTTVMAHKDKIATVALCRGHERAVSASWDRTIRVWDLRTGAAVGAFTADGPIYDCATTRDGNVIIASDALGRHHILRLSTRNLRRLDGENQVDCPSSEKSAS